MSKESSSFVSTTQGKLWIVCMCVAVLALVVSGIAVAANTAAASPSDGVTQAEAHDPADAPAAAQVTEPAISVTSPASAPTTAPSAAAATTPQTTTAQYIGEARAKSVALDDAGLTEQAVTFITAYLDRDDGRMVYDIEFYSDNTEYDYEIDALTGDIREHDREIENYSIPRQPKAPTQVQDPTQAPTQSPTKGTTANTDQYIGESQAKSIALNHAGLSESQVQRLRVELDREDGRIIYEVDFREGRMEYEYEIGATDGKIYKADKDYDD